LAYTEITAFTIPPEADAGTQIEFNVAVKLLSQPSDWSNLAVGFEYTDGPSDSVEIFMMGTYQRIPKGNIFVSTMSLPNVGEEVTVPIILKPIFSTGVYTFTVKSGHVNGTFSEDAYLSRTLNVKGAAAPPPASTTVEISGLLYSLMALLTIFMLISLLRSIMA
jgi:hypothetical protein